MTCHPLKLPGGVAGFACDRSRRTTKCKACGKHGEPKLCDFVISPAKSCDAKCCSLCARHVGPDIDYCPKHAKEPTVTDDDAPTAEEEVGQTKQSTVPRRIKPKPAAELAVDLAAKMADTLVLDVGHRAVDARALNDAGSILNAALIADRRAVVEWYRNNVRLLMQTIGADEGKCSSCGVAIWWVVTKVGKRSPISADGLSHFSDCPHAKLHRKAP